MSGRLDFSAFEATLKSREQTAGRPCGPPRLLASLWIYSHSLGVASARALEPMMAHEPGMRWLAGNEVINHYTLSDFQVGSGDGVEGLFAQFLTPLETAGVVDFQTMLRDGRKVTTVAGRSSLHRRKTLRQRLKQARKVVRGLDRRASEETQGADRRREAAQKRAAEEAVRRATSALENLKKPEADETPRNRKETRVSDSEPDARRMKHADGSWAPSYNGHLSIKPKSRMIVAVGVSTKANDTQALLPAVEKAKGNAGPQPRQVIADNGYATRGNVGAPGQSQFQKQCSPGGAARQVQHVVESPAMKRYLSSMKRPEIRTLYKKRSEIAEFPICG